MARIERYILGIAFTAFLACLLGLTGIIWITQALRELDLLTGKGQTLWVFLTFTALSLPALVSIIAPIALFIAVMYTLNRLNGDSELIVMSAAGMAPGRLLRPFLWLGGGVSLVVAVMTLWLVPASFNELRDMITRIRADFLATMVREGQFTELQSGVTFSYRERAGETLQGIFMQDGRDAERIVVYVAERGRVSEVDGQSYLVLEQGSIHRQTPQARDSSIITFERYAVDLSAFTPSGGLGGYKPRERSTMELLNPDPEDAFYRAIEGRFRAELHDRLTAWLYPLAMVGIAFAALGDPRTTRQGRGIAIGAAIAAVVATRIAGFAASSAVTGTPEAWVLVWGVPLLTLAVSWVFIFRAARIKPYLARLQSFGMRIVSRRTPAGST